ncbi:MAG TPA: DUF2723 domain-containing protein [Vicinamibacterales bacterium]
MARRDTVAALIVALIAFALYHATLLPGFDFGDTGSFQATVGSSVITTRDAYPAYFAIGNAFLWLTGGDPAHALNLASAIEGAAACGLLVVVAAELSGSVAAGTAAALLFAVSYTFWSQAIIAEVYSLHIMFMLATLWLLLRWSGTPTLTRLTIFFAVYALGFGNHLSMVLLLPGYTAFLLLTAPDGWRSMFAPKVVAIAIVCACVGALQYGWNLRSLWLLPQPPDGLADALSRFWFDVTKSDWRDTMVMNVPRSMLADHVAMYWFDLTQQFGRVIPAVAAVGWVGLAWDNWRRAALLLLLFAANVVFAFSYNVGDSHVFYLPSHLLIALLVAPAIALIGQSGRRAGPVAAAALVAYAALRGYRDFPALDRSHDRRPTEVLAALTAGLDGHNALLLTDLNWQIDNGLSYFASVVKPDLAYLRTPDVLLRAPALIAENRAQGRQVALTERSRTTLASTYGPLLAITRDPRAITERVSEVARSLTPGTRYVLCVLRPSRDLQLDAVGLSGTLERLTGGHVSVHPPGDYAAVAGTVGAAPLLIMGASQPFHTSVSIDGVAAMIRMESWLASDTIRRMGFGHVIVNHQHTLIVERGVSLVTFGADGQATRTAYESNIFARQARYLVDYSQP